MIDDLIRNMVVSGKAAAVASLEGIKSVWDFDPDVIPDEDYPAMTIDYVGSPGRQQQPLANGQDLSFNLAVTVYTADAEPGAAKRELRQLMYAGNEKGVMAWLETLARGHVQAAGRVYAFQIGQTRTGVTQVGGTHSAAASVTITVISRGR